MRANFFWWKPNKLQNESWNRKVVFLLYFYAISNGAPEINSRLNWALKKSVICYDKRLKHNREESNKLDIFWRLEYGEKKKCNQIAKSIKISVNKRFFQSPVYKKYITLFVIELEMDYSEWSSNISQPE